MLDDTLLIKPIPKSDSIRLWELCAKETFYPWTLTNAPYFEEFETMTYETFMEKESKFYFENPNVQGMYVKDVLIGTLNRYYNDKRTRWMETGIVLFDDAYWNQNLGTVFMKAWIQDTFDTFELERIGFTTWSGNPGMMRIGTKLGMTKDRHVQFARYYNGTYYDSIGYGITRKIWHEIHASPLTFERINDQSLKSNIASTILNALPQWFGIESSTLEYIEGVKAHIMIVAKDGDAYVGFLSLDTNQRETDEIYVMGMHPDYHNQGYGKTLMHHACIQAKLRNKKMLLVKTLSAKFSDANYENTRHFYHSYGFIPLHEDGAIWGETCPCLIMGLPL